jgi:DNA-directed RNA polymerase subunit alpha
MNTSQFTFKAETETKDFARFIIEPLPQGFGDTLGNSLRRVLYTTIQGAALTSVKIAGVNHQFSTLEGMREDVIQLILALKQVRVAYQGDKPAKITLEVTGPAEVKAGDFQTPSEVVITNPDLVIATLADKNTKLDLEVTVESGFGYSPAEDRKSSTLGVIPLDATFTPVVRVNYKVEATRVGRVTDFDKLILEVYTDGTVAPQSAVMSAAQTLVDYFAGIVNPQTAADSKNTPATTRQVAGANISVEELDLPTRIANALQKAGFQTLADVLAVPKAQLAKVKNLGGKSVDVIVAALKVRGFELAQ